MPKEQKLVDVGDEWDIRTQTDKAYCLSDGKRDVWVPKSQVEANDDGTWTMPEWLAKDKGFI